MTLVTKTLTAGAVAAILGLAQAPAMAQSATQQPAQPSVDTASLTDAKIEAFIDAAGKVRQIIEDHQDEIEAAQTEADRAAIAETVNGALVEALGNTPGITLEEYVTIARAARQDQDLYNRIRSMMEPS